MSELLKIGQSVSLQGSSASCTVEEFLGSGGQGEVYRAAANGKPCALKWYYAQYAASDARLRERIERAIASGPPNDRFLWPQDLASHPDIPDFGYVMPLREAPFASIVDLMLRRVEPSFRALATAGFELAHAFLQLHTSGLCYHDISQGNVFFDPRTGEIRICDNDNVDIDGMPGSIGGTMRYMAPEVVIGAAPPTAQTDLHSLAVLLFYMLVLHHPLEGKREASIRCFDGPANRQVYGTQPIFIFDPGDDSNRPVPGIHDNALEFWPLYPRFLKELFTRAFTVGIKDPQHGRVRESEWRSALIRLRDSIIYCACGAENFYDAEALKASGGPGQCWRCKQNLRLPFRLRIGKQAVIMLNHDSRLFPHHVDEYRSYDFSSSVAEVARHPANPLIWGLKNTSGEKWVLTGADGSAKDIEPGRSVTLAPGIKLNFGHGADGEVRL